MKRGTELLLRAVATVLILAGAALVVIEGLDSVLPYAFITLGLALRVIVARWAENPPWAPKPAQRGRG